MRLDREKKEVQGKGNRYEGGCEESERYYITRINAKMSFVIERRKGKEGKVRKS